ncbi:MAG: CYTH domain-containing protein [Clostridia bacterium]|nr:CYTH domain-containing protein [Clostridia bacterium]
MKNENYEIERKFLIKTLPNNLENFTHHKIKQGYISTNPTIRLRQWDDKYILTVKSAGLMKKLEYEIELTREQFDGLWLKVEGNTIEKTRYIIPLDNNLKAELDIYKGVLSGFMNVEVEFPSTKSAIMFNSPDWFGQEVTQDARYSNSSLAKFGKPAKN